MLGILSQRSFRIYILILVLCCTYIYVTICIGIMFISFWFSAGYVDSLKILLFTLSKSELKEVFEKYSVKVPQPLKLYTVCGPTGQRCSRRFKNGKQLHFFLQVGVWSSLTCNSSKSILIIFDNNHLFLFEKCVQRCNATITVLPQFSGFILWTLNWIFLFFHGRCRARKFASEHQSAGWNYIL